MAQTQRLSGSARTKLIFLLPRLRRFAAVLAGNRESADALLRAACKNMLDGARAFQQGTAFDLWAFGELHGEWLAGLRSHNNPISQGQGDASAFLPADASGEIGKFQEIAEILAKLPPQQRSAVLLIYGDGFSYDEASQILDAPLPTIIARVSRALGSFVERADWLDSAGLAGAKVEQLQQTNRQAGR
ncbi:MAG TPA: hypothetical protein ENH05_02550 [Rhizobiales bacterium]|nr:RNA polymerase sigma factor [bacterium BMS3Bbin10]HDO51596.1 hypothetical protein [Hyphomicrobiales bacterium]